MAFENSIFGSQIQLQYSAVIITLQNGTGDLLNPKGNFLLVTNICNNNKHVLM